MYWISQKDCLNKFVLGEKMILRNIALVGIAVLTFSFVGGCKKEPALLTSHQYSEDIDKLSKLCVVPDYVESVKWQSYSQGNDWGILAILTVSSDASYDFSSLFTEKVATKVMLGVSESPSWLGSHANLLSKTKLKGIFETKEKIFEPDLFEQSPLIHGFVLWPDENTLILGLHTQ